MKKLIPFSLEAALAGATLKFRNGEDCNIVAYVPSAQPSDRVVVSRPKTGSVFVIYEGGTYFKDGLSHELDIFVEIDEPASGELFALLSPDVSILGFRTVTPANNAAEIESIRERYPDWALVRILPVNEKPQPVGVL